MTDLMKILSDEEILAIYEEHGWMIFQSDLNREKTVAKAQHDYDMEQVVELFKGGYQSSHHGFVHFRISESDWQDLKQQIEEVSND